MQKKYSIKKILNNSLLNKKLKANNFALILDNTSNISKTHNKNFFTKNSLTTEYIIKVSKKIKLHYPLNFIFFKTFGQYSLFIENYFKYINILKIKNKIFKKI
jgi:hypothetical protein